MRACGILVAASTGCVMPFATPPMRADIGAATPVAREPTAPAGSEGTAVHLATGTSLASATTDRPLPYDVGFGYLMESSGAGATSHGAYVDAALFVAGSGRRGGRASVGLRVELRSAPDGAIGAMKARFDAEVYTGGSGGFSGSDRCGTASGRYHGTSAIGLYAEGGPAIAPDGTAFVASAGVSMRIPSLLGVWVGIPWCR